jgi:hypothetical protein
VVLQTVLIVQKYLLTSDANGMPAPRLFLKNHRSNKLVRIAAGFGDETKKDDGMFWMQWSDYSRLSCGMTFVVRSTQLTDIALHTYEEKGLAGPCIGCAVGCLEYVVCCQGCRFTCCAEKSIIDIAQLSQDHILP